MFTGHVAIAPIESSTPFASILQSSWTTIALLVGGCLLGLAAFALVGEVFLGFGYWMLVCRGATFSNADSLRTVRATAEDRALAGEGLADALERGGLSSPAITTASSPTCTMCLPA